MRAILEVVNDDEQSVLAVPSEGSGRTFVDEDILRKFEIKTGEGFPADAKTDLDMLAAGAAVFAQLVRNRVDGKFERNYIINQVSNLVRQQGKAGVVLDRED